MCVDAGDGSTAAAGAPHCINKRPVLGESQSFLIDCITELSFLRATAGTAIARLSHRNSVRLSVCLSVRPSVTRVDQAKTVQARIIKSSPSAAPKTLVSGSVTLFQKFHRGHPNRGP